MYTLENNIDTLQDIVEHISNISKVEAAITDEFCITLANKGSLSLIEGSFCFVEEKIFPHCIQFLNFMITDAITNSYTNQLCWAGIRLTINKFLINNKIFYFVINKYKLDSDYKEINKDKVLKINCNEEEIQKIKLIFDAVPVLSIGRVEELFSIMKKCITEFDERGILT